MDKIPMNVLTVTYIDILAFSYVIMDKYPYIFFLMGTWIISLHVNIYILTCSNVNVDKYPYIFSRERE